MTRSSAQTIQKALYWAAVLAAIATIPVVLAEQEGHTGILFDTANWTLWSVFAVEYGVGLAVARDRWHYFRTNPFGLAIVVLSFPLLPSILGFARLARLVNLLRLMRLLVASARGVRVLGTALGRRGLGYLAILTVILILAAGAVMSILEPDTVKGGFWAGVWWATATVSTVGYGDISPTTPGGRLIAVVLMVVGIGLASTLAAAVAAYFVKTDSEREQLAVETRLARVEALLERLVDQGEPTPDRRTRLGKRANQSIPAAGWRG
jgi:voltage-gated potassium channel